MTSGALLFFSSFGSLFSSGNGSGSSGGDPLGPYVNMKYTDGEGGEGEVGPALSAMRARSVADRRAARASGSRVAPSI